MKSWRRIFVLVCKKVALRWMLFAPVKTPFMRRGHTIILVGLPDMDVLSALKDIKLVKPETPVIICTARDALDDRLKGLNSGSDYYSVKPFDVSELVARVKAALRRPGGALGLVLETGNIHFHTVDRSVKISDKAAKLSKRELDLLELFMRRKGRIQFKDAIENALHGFNAPPSLKAIEVAPHRL